jgi:coenzyme PQQ precursor peptide PqqA
VQATNNEGGQHMTWHTPIVCEISLGCEINAYACAEMKK